eukprot:3794122-Rhodomonas_salina.1
MAHLRDPDEPVAFHSPNHLCHTFCQYRPYGTDVLALNAVLVPGRRSHRGVSTGHHVYVSTRHSAGLDR